MKVKVKYFGMLAEVIQNKEEEIDFSGETIADFISILIEKYAALEACSFQIAQNQSIVSPTEKVSGAEIALLPPFSGG